MFDINLQFTLFIYSLFIGIYLGVSYDLVNIFILKYTKKILTSVIQIVFFIVQGYIVFRVLFHVNYGLIPFYSYLLFLIGFMLYHRFTSSYHREYLTPVEKTILWIIGWIQRIFTFMVITPILDVWKFIKWIYQKLLKFINWFKKKLERPVKFFKKRFKRRKLTINFRKRKKKRRRIGFKIQKTNN